MFRNYIRVAWRNLFSNKSFSTINVVGLSIGMTCCLIIFQYVTFEAGFDRFHDKRNQIYRVLQAWARGSEDPGMGHAYTAQSLTPALKEGVPDITRITRLHSEDALVTNPLSPDKTYEENRILYADEDFLEMFSFPAVEGNPPIQLLRGNILITESAAKKYFGETDPIGQTLQIVGNIEKTFTVAGVLREVPKNSHLQFTMLLPMADLLNGPDYSAEPEGGWSWNNFTTYIEVHPGADLKTLEKKMTDVFLKHRGEVIKQQGGNAVMHAQPLSDIHLNSEISGAGSILSGSYKTLYFFLVIGLITLTIALVNYINLATARALNRAREVGVRKVVGAKRGQLVVQFLYESAITNISAVVIALALTAALLPTVNSIAETQLEISQWLEPGFVIALAGTLLSGTLLAGLYPAFVLSSFRPASVLKGRTSYMSSHLWLRKGLVVVQFMTCIVLVGGTGVVYNQLNYMRTLDLGLDLEQVVAVGGPRMIGEGVNRPLVMQAFINEIKKIAGVKGAALSSTIPGQGFNWNGAAIRKSTDDPAKALQGVVTYIDSAFADLYELKLVAGKEFSEMSGAEAGNEPWMVMINETAARNLGYQNPSEAIDESLNIGGNAASVVGVYKDFKWSSAHEAQQNIVFGRTSSGRYVSIKLATKDFSSVLGQIQLSYEALFPGNVFSYNFVDDVFDLQYRNDQRFAKLFSIFAGMTIFIACLGLFGLVAFTAQQRTKEIGMRKVLGASVGSIVQLLSVDFLKLVAIGFVLAVPITIYAMNQWLSNFAYRTSLGVGLFIFSGLIALIIAIATVSWQSLKAATANPVKSLRSE
ncbi:ABC transporter permease [Chryseosolibacter indicus]|uniref:ABC transporter permease n=1 Tax=Chryseosolibacter indicus TaxID=2782351 RepID=A0ABS5VWM9_9BACT|nr:ABC transporter permease [Chryseosolibacter indicus]MBT1705641.1 ABC transporter permease [Chryseosolibacter indicus]